MLDTSALRHRSAKKRWRKLLFGDGIAAYQLVGGVTAHQGDDG